MLKSAISRAEEQFAAIQKKKNKLALKEKEKARQEIPRNVWVVVREAVMAQAMPPHFQLANAMMRSRTIMMSTSALLDKNLFKRVEE